MMSFSFTDLIGAMPPYSIPEPLKMVLLAIVQGIAEFLPISSSGHLVVLNALFGTPAEEVLGMGIMLHLGTLIAILVFYRHRILALLQKDRRVIPLLIVGTIPAAVIGIYLKKNHEWITTHPLLAGFMLPITGFILLALAPKSTRGQKDHAPDGSEGRRENKESEETEGTEETESTETNQVTTGREYQSIGFGTAILIGLAQAFAILPGISRSGSTIVAGVLLGLKRESAATFSFLLAIPAIGGASLLEIIDIIKGSEAAADGTPLPLLLMGLAISFLVGWASLAWLVKWLEQGKIHWFAYWVIPLGFLVVVWQLYQIVEKSSL